MELFQYLWGLKCRVCKGNMLIETIFVYTLAIVWRRMLLKSIGQFILSIRSFVLWGFTVLSIVRKSYNEVIK